jgi:hypothetical protein
MSGMAINTIDWLMKTMRVPSVMVKRATHLYRDRPVRGAGAPFELIGSPGAPVALVIPKV